MIHKRIDKAPDVPDDFTNLAEYIAAASEEGEKLDQFWIGNCHAGTELADLDAATAEVEAVRAQKPKILNKTYHLVISFQPGEENRLDKAALQDIVGHYAEALGFSEHQYVAGSHINTDNMHIHVAFNRIHPQTLKAHAPFNDFKAMEKVARAMEKKYGLAVDRGMSDPKPENSLSPGARDFEANTWTESFQRHVLRHKDAVLAELKSCRTWADAHTALARYDIRITPHGAGMVLTSPDGQQTMKASALHRSCGKAALERRFGPYEPASVPTTPKVDQPAERPDDEEGGSPPSAPPGDDPPPPPPAHDPPDTPPGSYPPDPPPGGGPPPPPPPTPPGGDDPTPPAAEDEGAKLTAPVLARYKPRPLVRRPESTRLWRRYLDVRRRKRSTLLGRTIRNWKMYLMSEAFRDPLAVVLVMAHQEFLSLFFDPVREEPRKPPRVQPEIRQALAAWRDTSDWSSAGTSAWVKDEKLASAGVRVDDAGNLVVPFRDVEGGIQGVRMIAKNGETLDLGHLGGGAMHIIDPKKQIDAGARVVIATDYRAALAIHRATRAPVVLAPSEEAVPQVIEALERKHGPLKPVIAAQTPEIQAPVTHPRVLVPPEAKRHTLRSLFAEALGDTAALSWDATTGWAKPATNAWLKEKGVPGFGVRQRPDGGLAVPLRTLAGRLEAVLEIASDGRMRRSGRGPDGPPLVHIIDPARQLKNNPTAPIVIATGYAEAAGIHRATRAPVIMAPSPEEWADVAKAMREKWPKAPVVAALPLEIAARDEVRAEELGVMVVPESASDFTGPQHAEFLRGVYAEALDDQVFMHWGAGRVPTKDVRDAHPWLGIGRMKAGTRLDDTGNLLLPLRDSSLRLAGVMAVDGAGKTQYRVDDVGSQETPAPLFHVLGGWLGRDGKAPMVVTDNLETAVKLHRETKATVVFAADDIESVTRSLQERFPQRPMHLVRYPKLAERLGAQPLPVGPGDAREQMRLKVSGAALPLRGNRQTIIEQQC
jgi:phage/plasmid primase-like uncharacterized protein